MQKHSTPQTTHDEAVIHASLPYASPEILQRQSSSHQILQRQTPQDIWALGCVLHALLTGVLPFADSFEPRLYLKILNGEWESRSPVVDGDRVILRGCLRVDPLERWTIDKLENRAHEVGTAEYARIQREARQQRRASRSRSKQSRSRVRESRSYDSSRSSSQDGKRSRERSTSRMRQSPWSPVADSPVSPISPSPISANGFHISHSHHRTHTLYHSDPVEEEEEEELNGRVRRVHLRRDLSSESRGAATVSEVLTPPDDSVLATLGPDIRDGMTAQQCHASRSRSRGRSSSHRLVSSPQGTSVVVDHYPLATHMNESSKNVNLRSSSMGRGRRLYTNVPGSGGGGGGGTRGYNRGEDEDTATTGSGMMVVLEDEVSERSGTGEV